jgi:hypothetical protein
MPCGGTDNRFANQSNDHLNNHIKQSGVTVQQSNRVGNQDIFRPHEDRSENVNELIAKPSNLTPSNMPPPAQSTVSDNTKLGCA